MVSAARERPSAAVRVLHVLNHGLPTQDGYVYRTMGILGGQRALGVETFHLTSTRHEYPGERVEDVEGWRFYRTDPPPDRRWLRLPVLREIAEMRATTRRLDEVVRAVRPDLIHAHSPLLNGYPALWVARRHGIPLVYEIRAFWEDAALAPSAADRARRNPRYRLIRALETALCHRSDAVVTICQGLRLDLTTRGVPAAKIAVVPNAIEAERFRPVRERDAALARQLNLGDGVVLGFIGSFYAYEGLGLLLDAMPAVLARIPDARLLLVGGGMEEAALRARAEALGLGPAVVFAGRVPHAEVRRYYSLIDVFIYPRLPMRLTELVTPLKPLEAMAAGRGVVVASDVGGHKELIEDGRTGFLFRAGDVGALVERLDTVLADRMAWPAAQAAAREFVRGRTWNAVARQGYGELFTRLCRRGAERVGTAERRPGPRAGGAMGRTAERR